MRELCGGDTNEGSFGKLIEKIAFLLFALIFSFQEIISYICNVSFTGRLIDSLRVGGNRHIFKKRRILCFCLWLL